LKGEALVSGLSALAPVKLEADELDSEDFPLKNE
jgi:hypothetical protein